MAMAMDDRSFTQRYKMAWYSENQAIFLCTKNEKRPPRLAGAASSFNKSYSKFYF